MSFRVWTATISVFLIVLAACITGTWLFEVRRVEQRRLNAADITAQVSDAIGVNLNRSLSATYALAAFIREGDGAIPDFRHLAGKMLTYFPGISNLQIAPNGIISDVVPLKGNEKAIGHNLLEDNKRNREALLAVQTRSLTLAGPFELVQGGVAVIGRLPIFLSDRNGQEYFWGFSNALIRIPEFLATANISRISANGYRYEIYRLHPDTGAKDVFASSGSSPSDPVSQRVRVPNGEWIVAVEPFTGWHSSPAFFLLTATISLLISATLAVAVWWFQRQPIILQKLVAEKTSELTRANLLLKNEVAERQLAEAALQQSENKIRSILASLTDVIIILDADGRYLEIAPTNAKGLYKQRVELLGKSVTELFSPEQADIFLAAIRKSIVNEQIVTVDYSLLIDGEEVWFSGNVSPLSDNAVVWSARDITKRKHAEDEKLFLEKQLLHTQKLESLGILAGGIAHDFNNILTTIIGNADLALMRIESASPALSNLQQIESAAVKAADLARQMLAYSGKGQFILEQIDLNSLVEDMERMLQISISKKVVLRNHFQRPLPAITGDATQLRQIIMNLVINASEAIDSKSGVIAISTGCQDYSDGIFNDNPAADHLSGGLYVYLEVADNGCGISGENLDRIFDPFFTTKFTGRGLGMSAVLGIVRGHKGTITVSSEVNKGTTFRVLFPASSKPVEIYDEASPHQDRQWHGEGTVLLVDDEDTVRGVGKDMLQELGFAVITASDGRTALDMFKNRSDITLVLLDLTMPHMDGEQCFRELKLHNSSVKVIISSGFSEQEVTEKFYGMGLDGFIQKPYRMTELREVLKIHAAPSADPLLLMKR